MLDYPQTTISKAADLKVGQPVSFTYPDASSPCTLVKTGRQTHGGVGPDGDIVAYSNLCTHMGCPVSYSSEGWFHRLSGHVRKVRAAGNQSGGCPGSRY
ncbi:arsenate reductase (azurin) small subunit [Marinobacter sp. TBZ242]|uniref:Arsenate reductase (Azurin) small subunit n=1 Tax=Marinobacter azerbaijanicus TaxID=3050455 RepID=A0ABT7IBA5_9GAMM|nr:arsenate reductase (azurin) small subunit [Marinobacter sp. TBZ242]MDL0430965.1 arsenate reductase (azurin) small subunit [Marinobacter sp. TBZ242]